MNSLFRYTLMCLAVSAVFFQSCKKEVLTPDSANDRRNLQAVLDSYNGVAPTNPYYTVDSLGKSIQVFSEYTSANVVKDRLTLRYLPSDYLPTGLYATIGDTLQINVQKAGGNTLPKLLIGTDKRDGNKSKPQVVQLQEGNNVIIASKRGSLWIRYSSATPSGVSTLTFSENIKRCPVFIKNKSDQRLFSAAIQAADTTIHDILLVGQNTISVLPRSDDKFRTQNNNNIIQQIDIAWETQERFSGLDGSSNLDEPYRIPHVLTIMEPPLAGAGALAGDYSTGYTYRFSFYENHFYAVWFQTHEFGHKHQQLWDWKAENSADFYAIATNINLGLPDKKIARDGLWVGIWDRVQNYFDKPDAERDYSKIIEGGAAGKDRCLGAAMMIQLKYAYGDNFYHQLHKRTRIEKPNLSSAEDKYKYFMLKACQISGHDLTTFFKKWGFKYPDTYTAIAGLNLPKPATDPSSLFNGDTPIK